MSLDKDASSDPNLKAVHAGASMRKAQHLQPKASDIADAEVGYFAFSRLAAHIRVLSKSGEKPTLPAKRSFCPPFFVSGFVSINIPASPKRKVLGIRLERR